jgi:CRISP-associated protein Cas1
LNPLLISGFGTSISVDKRRLVIYNRLKEERLEFYPHQIGHDSIIVDGHTGSITFDAIRWLMKHDINLTILNWNGNLLGITLPKEPKNGKLKVMQYQTYLDNKRRYTIALEIVDQKIAHTFNLINELSRYYSEIDVKAAKEFFTIEHEKFSGINAKRATPEINDLMLYEGRIATFYWGILTKIFNRLYPDFHFVKRGGKSYSWNMNASDEINALLNYGYAILESEIRKDINAVGLEPTVGLLHELAQTKMPIVYDIQELFRWLVDLSVLQILEEKKLKKSDFILTENYHLRLKPTTAKMLIEKMRLNFNAAVNYKAKNHTYQNILFDNVQHLANHIIGKEKDLEFAIPHIRLPRTDPIEIQQKILLMSSVERMKLGINKSTLWYQKRALLDFRSRRIYKKTRDKLSINMEKSRCEGGGH